MGLLRLVPLAAKTVLFAFHLMIRKMQRLANYCVNSFWILKTKSSRYRGAVWRRVSVFNMGSMPLWRRADKLQHILMNNELAAVSFGDLPRNMQVDKPVVFIAALAKIIAGHGEYFSAHHLFEFIIKVGCRHC